MISLENIKIEPDDNVNEDYMKIFNFSNKYLDNQNQLSKIQNILEVQDESSKAVSAPRSSIKEWLVNGLLHCTKCRKTKQITNAFRRPVNCPDCKVSYINQCAVCKKKFTKFRSLRKHLQLKCDNLEYNSNHGYFTKPKSEKIPEVQIKTENVDLNTDLVRTNLNLNIIKSKQHTYKRSNHGPYKLSSNRAPYIRSKVPYKCTICEKEFTNKYRRNRHEKCCLKCERCEFKATESDELRDHMKKMHYTVDPNDYFKCSKCDKPFTCKYSKNNHEKYCGLELNLKCTECYYETTRIERLQAHIKSIHINILPKF